MTGTERSAGADEKGDDNGDGPSRAVHRTVSYHPVLFAFAFIPVFRFRRRQPFALNRHNWVEV